MHSAKGVPAVAASSYCKLYLGETPIIGGFGQGKSLVPVSHKNQGSSHQTFHTKVQSSATKDCPEWNEKFQLNVRDPSTEILTIRVKNHVLIYSPAVGACVVHLRQLQLGETIDEWFPLYKNDKASGQIRLQICLRQNEQTPTPERRYSQASEETIQRLMQEHRQLEEAQRQELEMQQEEKWRKMEEDAMKRVGVEEQMQREEKWREQCAKRLEEQKPQKDRDSDSELPASFKNRGGKVKEENDSDSELPASFKYRGVKTEEKVATNLMETLNLQVDTEENKVAGIKSGVSSGYTIYDTNFGNEVADYQDGFGTIRLSVEELNRVVHNSLPTSDSSDSTSSEYEHRRRRRRREEKKHNRRKKKSKRRVYSDDESSDTSSVSPRRYRKGSSRLKVSENEDIKKKTTHGSVSSRSASSNQNQIQQDPDVPVTLTFPPSPANEVVSSSEDERRRHRRRKAEKAKKREKERKRRSRRKRGKARRNYESSYSSLSPSSSSLSSSSLSSSEEERLRRKLKIKQSKRAKVRAKLSESGGSRASTQTSGMRYQNKLSYAESRNIDSVSPYVAQHWDSEHSDIAQVNGEGHASRPAHRDQIDNSSNTEQTHPVNGYNTSYGPDGVGFDEPQQTPMPQYLGQTTKEQTNAELMRSFCF